MFHIAILAFFKHGFASSAFAAAAGPQCDTRTMCACLPDVSTHLDETGFLQLGSSLVQARPALGNRSRDSASGFDDLAETARTMHVHEDARLDRMALTIPRSASPETVITRRFTATAQSQSQTQSQTRSNATVFAKLGIVFVVFGVFAALAVVGSWLDFRQDWDDPTLDSKGGLSPCVENTFENLPPSLAGSRPGSSASSPVSPGVRPDSRHGNTGGSETLLYSSTGVASAPLTTLAPLEGDTPDPPPICPQLIVANRRLKFFVPWNALKDNPRGESFLVMGASGRTLLYAEIINKAGWNCLSISTKGFQTNPIMAVLSNGTGGSQEVFGSSTDPYGILEAAEPSHRLLVCGGRPVLRIQLLDGKALRLKVTTLDGELLATSQRVEATVGSDTTEDFWKAEVEAGRDGVLIVGCMIAVILQGADELA